MTDIALHRPATPNSQRQAQQQQAAPPPPPSPTAAPTEILLQLPPRAAEPDDDNLYVVLPYFNYCAFKRRKQLFYEFVERIRDLPNVRIVISEAILVSEPESHQAEQALAPIAGIWRHLRYTTNNAIWLKENLVNLGMQHLPEGWKYASWVDADIIFMNRHWANDTIRALREKYDVVQMFFKCENLTADDKVDKTDRSFGYMHCESGKEYNRAHKYGLWHPGFAWALTRAAYDQMRGLVEFGILGSGDTHMALSIIGKSQFSHPGNIHPVYRQKLADFQERAEGLRLGYLPDVIRHCFHGNPHNRFYRDRWQILTDYAYDPSEDIAKNDCGLIQLTRLGSRLERPLRVYFAARREDDGTYNTTGDAAASAPSGSGGPAGSGSSPFAAVATATSRPGPNGPDLKTLLKNARL